MARCELKLVLDRAERTYGTGEEITGRVEVTALEACECRNLELITEWRAHGKGNKDRGICESQALFSGRWERGQSASYPFKPEAPYAPLTYQGKLFSIDWDVRVHADLAHALDAEVEERFVLVPGKKPPEGDREEAFEEYTFKEFSISPAATFVTGLLFFSAGLLFTWYFLKHVGYTKQLPTWSLVAASASVLFGGGALWYSSRHLMLEKKLGKVEVHVEPEVAPPGGTIKCRVQFRPHADLELNEVTLRLAATESTVKGSGRNKRRLKEVVHHEDIVLAPRRQVMAEEGVTLEGSLTVPKNAPTTIDGYVNNLAWKVTAQVNLRHWPDWKKDFAVTICP